MKTRCSRENQHLEDLLGRTAQISPVVWSSIHVSFTLKFNFPKFLFFFFFSFPILCYLKILLNYYFLTYFLCDQTESIRVLHPNAFFPWILGYQKAAKGKSRLYALIFIQVHTFLSLSLSLSQIHTYIYIYIYTITIFDNVFLLFYVLHVFLLSWVFKCR